MANIPMVFVSSTKIDLQPEREAALAVLQRLKLPHNSMESFGANAQQPLETCLAEVENCNVFVIVVGHRYGDVPEAENASYTSYTEVEYRRALESEKPVLVYIKDDGVPVLPAYVEKATCGNEKLSELKKQLCSEHTVSLFRSEVDLAVQLAIDLQRVVQDLKVGAPPTQRARHTGSAPSMGEFDAARRKRVKSSLRYGGAPSGLEKVVQDEGYVHDFIGENELIDESQLENTGILILPCSGHARQLQLSDEEIDAIATFVASGGGLLCAGQAWSWVYTSYGNKPIEMFPLNALGRVLGFHISGRNIGEPDPQSADQEVFGDLMEWKCREKWPPSQVESKSETVKVALKDQQGRAMALRGTYQNGHFVVIGHEGMLQYNPKACGNILKFIYPPDATDNTPVT